jgi:hypothetical protein
LELAIVAIFALVIIYAASFAIRVTRGFSKTVESPEFILRLQILNGCGEKGAANQVTQSIPDLVKMPLEVKVIDVDNFDSYNITESFIISREKDLKASMLLADKLGLDRDKIVYKPIENNYRSISATLVLGSDFKTRILDTGKDKEN